MQFPEKCPEGAVAVVTDVHPDEWLSQPDCDLYASLRQDPIEGIWVVRGNERTLMRNRETGSNDRCTDYNMQMVTPEYAAAHPDAYEVLRRPELTVAVAAANWL